MFVVLWWCGSRLLDRKLGRRLGRVVVVMMVMWWEWWLASCGNGGGGGRRRRVVMVPNLVLYNHNREWICALVIGCF